MAARPPPVSQQMEQIDQQIVALLQDIDESFSNLHQTIATRLIPSVKRFNHNAAPTREFAKFWRQFFEMAANTRVPDAFSYNEHPSQTTAEDDSALPSDETVRSGDGDEDLTVRLAADERTNGESSFMAGLEGLGSSTPLHPRRHVQRAHGDDGPGGELMGEADETVRTEDEFIMESPVDRLGRLLRADLALGAPSHPGAGHSRPGAAGADASSDAPQTEPSSTSFGSLPAGAAPPTARAQQQAAAAAAAAAAADGDRVREPWEDDDDLDSPDASFAEAYSLDEYAAYQDRRAAEDAAAANAGGATPRATTSHLSKPPVKAGVAAAGAPVSRIPAPSSASSGYRPYISSLPQRAVPSASSSAAAPARTYVPPSLGTPQKPSGTPSKPRAYTGLTDLSKTPLSTSKRTGQRTFGFAPSSRASLADDYGSDSDSSGGYDDFLPPGMSPPVTMNFTLPPARGGRFVPDPDVGGGQVAQGAVRAVAEASSSAAAVSGWDRAPLPEQDEDDDDDDDDDSFDATFHGAPPSAAASLVPGSAASVHSYHSAAAVAAGGGVAERSFGSDSDSDSDSSSSEEEGGGGGGYPQLQQQQHPSTSYASSSQHRSYAAPSPAYSHPSHPSPDYSAPYALPIPQPSHGYHPAPPPATHAQDLTFNPTHTADDSLFAPLPPIPYPAGYVPPSPASTAEEEDTLGSLDDPFQPRRAGGHGRPGFGLYGTEGEMYTFNGGRLEDAGPTESPTPYVPEPKRY